jgi:glycosyltransferase involved in cell wall biosynthesis
VKILILIDWFVPAFKGGGPIQSVANMVENDDPDFEYRIICSNMDLDGTLLNVTPDAWVDYNPSTKVWYSSSNKSVLKTINSVGVQWKPDALFINGIYSLYYNILPILFAKVARKIISVRGTLHDGALAQKSFKKKVFLNVWKKLGVQHKYEFHASTEEEKGFVKKTFGPSIKVYVAANFPKQVAALTFPSKTPNQLRLISVALISPMKNHLRVLEALQNCKAQIEYDIYGPVKDPQYWQKCLEQIKKLPSNIQVNVKGELPPPQVEKVLSTAQVFILPSESENFGHALYEALIAGKPVITSHGTPWNNLKALGAGYNVSAVSIAELTGAITFFADMPHHTFLEWSRGANRYAKSKIDFDVIKKEYRTMFLLSEETKVPQIQIPAW